MAQLGLLDQQRLAPETTEPYQSGTQEQAHLAGPASRRVTEVRADWTWVNDPRDVDAPADSAESPETPFSAFISALAWARLWGA